MPDSAVPFDVQRLAGCVPPCLRERAHWVCWEYAERKGRWTKCPISPTRGGRASSIDSKSWGTFEQAITVCQAARLEGVGFVFSADDPYAGVDLDHCIDPTTGQPKPWAQAILDRLDSYSEISPSGAGIKIFVRASKAGPRCKSEYEDGAIEMYDRDRFFTLTGQSLHDPPKGVEERQVAVDALYTQVFGPPETAPPSKSTPPPTSDIRHLPDDEIIRLACASKKSGPKFASLWAGRWNEFFNSRSEADASVVFTLAFYTKDAGQIDRIFRRSALLREKWDELHGPQTYGALTIAKALATVSGQYQPRRSSKNRAAKPSTTPPLTDEPLPGSTDPTTGRLILSTERTLPTAEAYVRQFHQHPEGITLRHYAGLLMRWQGNRYVELEDETLRNQILPWLHAAVRMTYDAQSEKWVARDFPANPHTMNAALESLKAHTHLPATTASPSWLDGHPNRPNAREIIPCRSSLLHLPTMQRSASSPAFFAVNALD
ncbi:MAG: hypothetical protein SF069_03380 [Phycisphaerae bacterium]|nr:hypothetical protein [Phycisphaerae bacterium]